MPNELLSSVLYVELCTVCGVVLCVLSCVLYIEYGAGMLRSVLYVEQSTV